MHDDDFTPEELDELGALLVAERPRPSERFAAELDARVASRFARTAAAPAPSRWPLLLSRLLLSRPLIPAAATTLAVGLVALVLALNPGGGTAPIGDSARQGGEVSSSAGGAAEPSTGPAVDSAGDGSATTEQQLADAPSRSTFRSFTRATGAQDNDARKVERSASIELGTPKDHIDDVAQDVLSTTARFGGIVDGSSIATGTDSGSAQFALRIPSARLQPALAALSDLPDSHVLARSDEQQDVNQAYVSIRRQLVNARAERAGLVRALAAADTEDETLRLRARLDTVERTIAGAERAQRGLDRRIDFSSVSLSIRADGESDGTAPFTVGSALHDAGRVLEVAAGVLVIAAAALLPLALLLACTLPLAHTLRRRRREQALDSA